jgi:hypothetical protein
MTGALPFPGPVLIFAMGFAGLAFGLLYFASVRRTAALLTARKGLAWPLAFTFGRIAAAALFLALAARLGAAPLLAAFLGFLLARTVALRKARRGR